MKKYISVLCVSIFMSGFAFSALAETKMGFIDIAKAIQSTAAGKKAKAELEASFSKKKKDLDKKEADLKKMGQDFEKKRAILSEEALQAKQEEFQREMLKFQQEVSASQSEIQRRQQELTAPIIEKMQKAVAKVSKAKGLTLVLQNTEAVLYASPDLDFTQEVIKVYNSEK